MHFGFLFLFFFFGVGGDLGGGLDGLERLLESRELVEVGIKAPCHC